MLKKRYLFLVILVCFFAISAVSAEVNSTSDIVSVSNDVNSLEANSNINSIVNDTDTLKVSNDDVLTAGNNWYVNGSKTSSGDGKSETNAFKTLNEALAVVQDDNTIMIASGEYKGTNNTGLEINKTLNFIKYGAGEAIFDAESQRRIWNVTATSINITGLTFKNGKDDYGGAIMFINSISTSNINATFINNTAKYCGGANYFIRVSNSTIAGTYINNTATYDFGGANYFSDQVSNSTIAGTYTNNTAKDGGANYFSDQVSNSNIAGTYTNNTAKDGGANYFNNQVSNSNITGTYTNNTAKDGGANYFNNQVSNSNIAGTYTNNTAKDGGANLFNLVSNSNITGTYINNTATHYSGANYFWSQVFNSNITGTYINNTANNGGANYFYSTVFNSTIAGIYTKNNAISSGGANYFYSTVFNSTIAGIYTKNNAISSGGANYFNNQVSNSNITGTYINNTATQNGGANYFNNTVSNSNIIGIYTKNNANNGGANYFSQLSNSTIAGTYTNNTAKSNGGANLFSQVSNSKINATYINNTATQNAGVNYFCQVSNSIIDGTYINNTAQGSNNRYGYGGVNYFSSQVFNSNITGTYIKNNVTNDGGVNYFGGQVFNSTVTGIYIKNNVTNDGGVNYFGGQVFNSTVAGTYTNNTAGYHGGANYFSQVSNSTIAGTYTNNTANYGGANYFGGQVFNSTIAGTYINNTAKDGGANYFNNRVSNSTIAGTYIKNNAKSNGGANLFSQVFNSYISGTYIKNTATQNAGVNYFGQVSNSIIDGTYINNTAQGSNNRYGYGGVNYFSSQVFNSNITGTYINNTAKYYGGVNYFSSQVFNSTVTGIYIKNNVTNDGGVNYFGGQVFNSTVAGTYTNNTAGYHGGANYFSQVSNSNIAGTYTNNTAGYHGGANYFSQVFNSNITGTYTNNTANYGGANYFGGQVSNSNISGTCIKNTAKDGGANYFNNRVSNSTIAGTYIKNNAKSNGGANLFSQVSNSNITGTYINNTATQNGGAIYYVQGGGSVTNCGAFVYNIASQGSAIYFDSGIPTNLNYNWWGSNDPNWTNLINGNYVPSIYAVLNVTANPSEIDASEKSNIMTKFVWNGTNTDATNLLPKRNVKLTSNGTLTETEGDVGLTSKFSATTAGMYVVNATVDNEILGVKVISSGPVTDTWYVNASKTSSGDGKTPETAFKTLKEALDETKDNRTIMIAAGEYKGTDNAGLSISKNLNFIKYGDGEAIFDAEGLSRIWTVTATSINITGLTFKNGKDDCGGAIRFNMAISNSNINAIFINNTATQSGGVNFFSGQVFNSNIGGTYINNTASSDGGVNFFSWVSNSTISGTYINNTASSDGGVNYFNYGSQVFNSNISGTYINNTANFGGVNYFTGQVSNSNISGTYIKNTANFGGVNFFLVVSNSNISGTYINNTASSSGANSFSRVYNSIITGTYINNTASSSGANSFSRVSNSTISGTYINNTASSDGGANYFTWVSNSTISGTYINNTAETTGGANSLWEVSNSNIGGTYISNTAKQGGGANYYNSWVSNSNISGTYINNTAKQGGGANHFAIISNSTVSGFYINNTAKDDAIINIANPTNTNISNAIFLNNSCLNIIFAYSTGVVANNNWFGNNATNYDIKPKVGEKVNMTNWLFLNATANPTEIKINETAVITFKLYSYREGEINEYNASKMNIILDLTQTLGELDKTTALIGEEVLYTAKQSGDAGVTGKFETASYTINLKNNKIPTTINIVNSTVTLNIKDSISSGATLTPGDAGNLTYTSSNNTVVTVDANGMIKGFKEGTATITVIFDGNEQYAPAESKNITVTVNRISTSINIVNSTVTLNINDSVSSGASLTPGDAGNLTYASSNNTVAIVENGMIKGFKEGIAKITVIFGGNEQYAPAESKNITVTVNRISTSINIVNSTVTLNINDSVSSGASLTPGDAGNLTYASSNNTVVTVDANGMIKGFKEGAATITVIFGGNEQYAPAESKNITVTVNRIPTTINVSNSTVTLNINDSVSSGASLTPGDAGNLTYTSSNNTVVTVDANGMIKGFKEGTATITVIFDGNEQYAPAESKNITVTVNRISTTINIANATVTLNINDSVSSGATLTPADAGNLTYTSSNNTVVTVDANGLIKGLKEGAATITVSFAGDDEYAPAESKNITVTVNRIPTTINIANATVTLNINDGISSGATLTPGDAGNLTYTSSNNTVVTVDANGMIKGLKEGSAIITVSFMGNEQYAPAESKNIDVTVKLRDASVSVNNDTLNLNVDDTFDIIATTVPVDLKVTYTTSDASVATVDANGKVTAKAEGSAIITASVGGDGVYALNSTIVKITVSPNVIIDAPNVTKYYSGSERFAVTLKYSNGNPIANADIKITINGNTYTKTTDNNGETSIAINLNSGVYNVTTEYNGTKVYSTVTVKDTVIAKDVTKIFRNGTQYQGTFVDSKGNLVKNTNIQININGVFYTRTTDANGMAQLNINLPPGTYILTAINPSSGEQHTTIVTVLPNIVENYDLTKYYKNASQYSLRLLDDKGNPVGAGVSIQLNINGIFYTRTSDANGYVKMNINLPPGTYIITAEYKGLRMSNTIKVLTVLEAKDLVMKYHDGSQFKVKVLDGQGNPYAGQTVTYNINGVFYTKTTDGDGIAALTINLPAGEYIITSMYNGLNVANKVTIIG